MKKLINAFKNFFSKDIHIKIVSLVIAVFAWFVVMNTISPVELRTYSVPVKLENSQSLMDKGYIVSNREEILSQIVKIGVESTRPSLDELSKTANLERIYGKLDLSNVQIDETKEFPQTFILSVQPSLPSNLYAHTYSVVSYTPSYISIEIDKMATVDLDIDVSISGSPADNYEIGEPILSQDIITVHGPSGKIGDISKVKATIDVSNISEYTSSVVEPVVYDKNGNPMMDFVTEPSHITVDIDVHRTNTVEINKPTTIGTLPPYLEISSIDWSPKSITILGDENNVLGLESIDLPPVDLSNLNKSTVVKRDISDILQKSGVTLKNPDENNISISVNLSLVSPKEYVIKSSDIKVTGLPESKTITLPAETAIKISGTDAITTQILNPSVDVTGLSAGTHEVKLNINVPDNSAIENNLTVGVIIKDKETLTAETTVTETTTVSSEDASSSGILDNLAS